MDSTRKELREFGWIISGALAFVSVLMWWWGDGSFEYVAVIAVLVLFVSLIIPELLYYPFKVWMFLAHVLGFVMTHVILAALFFIILTPIALFAKLVGKRFVALEWSEGGSYWQRRSEQERKEKRYEQQF